jgi:hypothetical protein
MHTSDDTQEMAPSRAGWLALGPVSVDQAIPFQLSMSGCS